jgi:hypothetical protein
MITLAENRQLVGFILLIGCLVLFYLLMAEATRLEQIRTRKVLQNKDLQRKNKPKLNSSQTP